jgi:hypothetical protein
LIFSQDRKELRRIYVDAWRKAQSGEVLSPLEAQIARIIEDHPEYQDAMNAESLTESFSPGAGETNPFLHMGLHLAVRDQVSTDRPAGITTIFHKLTDKYSDSHETEHRMLDCLAETLWEAQKQNAVPDERKYLARLKRLLR